MDKTERELEIVAIKDRLLRITAGLANDSQFTKETAVEGLIEVIRELDDMEPKIKFLK